MTDRLSAFLASLSDMKDREARWYVPQNVPTVGNAAYYVLNQGLKRTVGYGTKWIDDPYADPFAKDSSGNYLPLRWASTKNVPKFFNDLRGLQPGTISARILNVFLEMGQGDFIEYRPIEIQFADSIVSDKLFIFKVLNYLPVVNLEDSQVKYRKSAGYPPGPAAASEVRLNDIVPDNLHIFSDINFKHAVFVSAAMKEKIEKLRPKPSNIMFTDPAGRYLI